MHGILFIDFLRGRGRRRNDGWFIDRESFSTWRWRPGSEGERRIHSGKMHGMIGDLGGDGVISEFGCLYVARHSSWESQDCGCWYIMLYRSFWVWVWCECGRAKCGCKDDLLLLTVGLRPGEFPKLRGFGVLLSPSDIWKRKRLGHRVKSHGEDHMQARKSSKTHISLRFQSLILTRLTPWPSKFLALAWSTKSSTNDLQRDMPEWKVKSRVILKWSA